MLLVFIQCKMLFQCPLILLPKILLFLSLSRNSAINLPLISLYCKNCLFIFQLILCNPCKDLPSHPVAAYVFLRVFGEDLCSIHGKEQIIRCCQTKISHIYMLPIILQEHDGFVENDLPLKGYIEFLPVYHNYPCSVPCIVISTKYIKFARL